MALARYDLDAMQTERLAGLRRQLFPDGAPEGSGTRSVRIALLGSMTLSQVEGGIVPGGLRRSLWVEAQAAEYGRYLQETLDPGSALAAFEPSHLLFAFDARTAAQRRAGAGSADEAVASFIDHVETCWAQARERVAGVSILQQTLLPVLPRVMGSNERRGSPSYSSELG